VRLKGRSLLGRRRGFMQAVRNVQQSVSYFFCVILPPRQDVK